MRYALYSHGGSQNHGCEALARTVSELIKTYDNTAFVKLYSFRKSEDEAAGLKFVDEIEEFDYTKPKSTTLADKLKISVLSKKSQRKADEYYYSLSCKNPSLRENDIYISIGGDNYCYGDSHMAVAMNKELKRLGKKTILWGCSIDEESLTIEKVGDLKSFDLIIARESITYKTLKKNGIDKNIVLFPDSAFTLKPDGASDVKPNTIGLNISDLICQRSDGKFLDYVDGFIKYLIEKTDKNILLIPHVTRGEENDFSVLSALFENNKCDRIGLIDRSLNAPEYKKIISQCEMFIGARTHATIAAYSTCVPTLVIGYSIKSKGIATDIFSTEDGLVVPIENINSTRDLINSYIAFSEKKDEYKKHLENVMPAYIEKARCVTDAIKNL